MRNTKKKVAIVYDWVDKWGGVERVLLHLHSLLPDADFYTSAVDPIGAAWAQKIQMNRSFIQSIPLFFRRKRASILPFYPFAFESMDFGAYDTVISITSAFAKGIITRPNTRHICYLLTPPRYLWSHTDEYLSPTMKILAAPLLSHLKQWDKKAAMRPDKYISISQTVANRAAVIYGVSSDVLFPPFDTVYWDKQKNESKKNRYTIPKTPYFLWVGRMEQYKKVELVCDVARQSPSRTFVFVGTGGLEAQLRRSAPKNCLFMGLISDEQLSLLYTYAQALIMPQNEDFGYVSLEAQYHGCPVIAYQSGGAIETVQAGVTGLFFKQQSTSSLIAVLESFDQISYNLRRSTVVQKNELLRRFGVERFNKQFIIHFQ